MLKRNISDQGHQRKLSDKMQVNEHTGLPWHLADA